MRLTLNKKSKKCNFQWLRTSTSLSNSFASNNLKEDVGLHYSNCIGFVSGAQYSQIYANNISDDVLTLICISGSGSGQMSTSQNDKGKYISWVGSVHKAGKAGNSISIVIVTLVQNFYQKSLEQISSSSCRPDSWQSPHRSWWVLLFLWTSSQLQVSSFQQYCAILSLEAVSLANAFYISINFLNQFASTYSRLQDPLTASIYF